MNTGQLSFEDEESAVYSTLINDLYLREGSRRLTILLETTASKLPHSDLAVTLQGVSGGIPGGINPEVVHNFLQRNEQPSALTARSYPIVEHQLLSKEDMDRIFQKGGGWVEYSSNYHAQGIIELSKVGFNQGGDQALVYTGIQSGLKTGIGYYVLLIKGTEGWKIKDKIEIWAS